MLKKLLIVTTILFISACGGGSGDGVQPNLDLQGQLIDSATQGVRYETLPSGKTGTTDASGTFKYEPGDTVSFYIGDILLGSATGAATITPVDLVPSAIDEMNPQVTNISRFLQSLDEDENLDNGIQISVATHTAFANQSMDFSLSEAAFETAFNSISDAVLGGTTLVTASDAQAHLRDTLATIDLPAGDGGLGRLTITGDSAAVALLGSTFDPVDVVSDSTWFGEGSFFQFSLREFNAQVIDVTLNFFGSGAPQFSIDCGTILGGNSCSGIDMNLSTKSVTFNNLELSDSGDSVIVLNGTLFWRENHQ
mgnify:CR=1 FL=1|tara:strand:- start:27238 stop:28164 length:927 start_codon:yes stop_codon:yes gene_type:complete